MDIYNNKKDMYDNGVTGVSSKNLFTLRGLGIKKEYLTELVLPFAERMVKDSIDVNDQENNKEEGNILVKDQENHIYKRRLLAETNSSNEVFLYKLCNTKDKAKQLIAIYGFSFDSDSNIIGVNEDIKFGDKHITVSYSVGSNYANGVRKYSVEVKELVLTSSENSKKRVLLGIGLMDDEGEDILKEMSNNRIVALIRLFPSELDDAKSRMDR